MIKNATAFEDDFADFVAGAGMADAFANSPTGRGLYSDPAGSSRPRTAAGAWSSTDLGRGPVEEDASSS